MIKHTGMAKNVWFRLDLRLAGAVLALGATSLLGTGCSTPAETAGAIAGGAVGITVAGGYSPAQEISQVYYLGVFDPQEQIPPTIYRLTVRGQSSAISGVKFGSGWVPAPLIDSLNSHMGYDLNSQNPLPEISAGTNYMADLKTGRRLIQFGPEGFREAPANHRLVIVMGSSPDKFFEAIDEALGSISKATDESGNAALRVKLFEALLKMQSDKERLIDLRTTVSENTGGAR